MFIENQKQTASPFRGEMLATSFVQKVSESKSLALSLLLKKENR